VQQEVPQSKGSDLHRLAPRELDALLHQQLLKIGEPLGAGQTAPPAFRLIAAAGADFDEARTSGRFLSELYFRLSVLEVPMPALRERAADIPAIATEMLAQVGRDGGNLSSGAMKLLEEYAYPGNLVELAHALPHASVLADGAEILPAHLPEAFQSGTWRTHMPTAPDAFEPIEVVLTRFEHQYLLQVLRSVDGNRRRAAELLELSRKGLWQKLKRHGIDADAFGKKEE